jgi:hypothetical protein
MEQTNVIMFPTQPPESERLRLYRDNPCIVVVLGAVRARDSRFARERPYILMAWPRIKRCLIAEVFMSSL